MRMQYERCSGRGKWRDQLGGRGRGDGVGVGVPVARDVRQRPLAKEVIVAQRGLRSYVDFLCSRLTAELTALGSTPRLVVVHCTRDLNCTESAEKPFAQTTYKHKQIRIYRLWARPAAASSAQARCT